MAQSFQTTEVLFSALAERAFAEMQQAERCAEQAKRRRATLRVGVIDEHHQRNAARGIEPPTDVFIEAMTDAAATQDPYWKSKVSGNQLHERRAAMYAGLAQVAAEHDRRTRESKIPYNY